MQTIDTVADREGENNAAVRSWNPVGRILFRFGFLYLGLFCVLYPQPLFAFLGPIERMLPDGWVLKWMNPTAPIVKWVGRTVFGTDVELHSTGSGDQAIFWVLVFCILVIAVAGTVLWTLLDRRRTEYHRLAAWFLLFIRL
ncbi:hypothetical protein VMT40_09855 [Nocardia sp. CDC160]|nr:hypothetical protein [Nocardia sp. CDC160]MEC3914902.1 hypothetical protein [Nocardia sp. CDC160]